MALTPNDILKISEPVELMYMDCAAQLIINLSRHFATDKALPTREWETKKLSELGALTDESVAIIAANTGKSPAAISKAITEGMGLSIKETESTLSKAAKAGNIIGPSYGWEASERVKTVVKTLTEQAVNDANIVNTVMLQSTLDRYVNAVQSSAELERELIEKLQSAQNEAELVTQLGKTQRMLNKSTMSVAVGAEARTAALRRTISQLAQLGITGYVDRAGRHWSPEAYINMDIRTTVHNAAVQGQRARSADYEVSTFQISSHSGARPLCAPYQGKIYSWDNTSGVVYDLYGNAYRYQGINTTSYGEPAGIFGINCGHNPQTFVDGYSVPRYEPTEDPVENAKQYELSQKQRQLERNIRHAKTEALAYDAAGDKEAFAKAARQVKDKQTAYREFCKDNKRTPRLDRTQVVGYNRSVSGKATAAAKKYAAKTTTAKPTAKSDVVKKLQSSSIEKRPVKPLKKTLTTDEIIAKVGGPDKTEGSCSSVALAYAGNRNGYDVRDFRGGDSQTFFAITGNIKRIPDIDKVSGVVKKHKNDFTGAHDLLKSVEPGKEYYLAVGRHAAIVRKSETGFEYLELQSTPKNNGFKPLDDDALKWRFGCQKSHSVAGTKYEVTNVLIDVDTLKGKEVKEMFGYINTKEDQQQKGAGGSAK